MNAAHNEYSIIHLVCNCSTMARSLYTFPVCAVSFSMNRVGNSTGAFEKLSNSVIVMILMASCMTYWEVLQSDRQKPSKR